VAATSCLDANTASTAAVVRGERAQAWVRSTGLPARLVDEDGRVVTVGGWPPEEEPPVLGVRAAEGVDGSLQPEDSAPRRTPSP
jgi:thiamine biosynthesis lipoprotein